MIPRGSSPGNDVHAHSEPANDANGRHSRQAPPPRPSALPVRADGIPGFLRDLPQWCLWRYDLGQRRGGEAAWGKVPYSVHGRRKASTTDASTWGTFEEATSAYRAGGWDGIGFVFAAGGGLVGVDLDDCRDPASGELAEWAREAAEQLGGYGEVSPSGSGIKLWCAGDLPACLGGRGRRRPHRGGEVEVYASGRYFCVTGERLNGAGDWPGDPQALDALCRQVFGAEGGGGRRPGPASARALDDAEVVRRAEGARGGDRFARLMRGDLGDHGGDRSRADLALCSRLYFWTGGDLSQVDRIFRTSGLMRSKWDERHGAQTYGQMTLQRVSGGEVYTGAKPRGQAEGGVGGRLPVGPLTLAASSPSATACRLSVKVCVAVEGKAADWLVLTASARSRKDAAVRVHELAARHSRPGEGPDRTEVEDALGQLLAWAAGEAEKKAGGPPLAEVLRSVVLPPLRLAFRTAEGTLWSETFGRAVNRYEFATMCDDATLCALEGCSDAPPDRGSLIFRARQEMATLHASLERELPAEAGADLGEDSERARQFREAVRQLWVIPALGETEEGRDGQDRAVQTSLAAKAAKRARGETGIDPAEPWRPVHRNHLAWWRLALVAGEVQTQLAMRADLAVQVLRRPLPGCTGDDFLLSPGVRYGAFRRDDGTARLTDGQPIAVLEHSLAEALLASPDNRPSTQTSPTEGEASNEEAE